MTRQKSEDRTVLQRRRKAAVTRRVERAGGGKATPVNEQAGQLGLGFETAENPAGTVGGTDWRARSSVTHAAPKSKHKDEPALSATMEGRQARPEERHFLGFRLRREPNDGEVEVLLSRRSRARVRSSHYAEGDPAFRARAEAPQKVTETSRACFAL
jgi:hypothetical protein